MSDFLERFPDMKPITKAPTLHTVNGIGTTIYGSRDYDPDTGTYVKTVWFAILFVPIVPLAAYRVADSPNGGWYFLGKVPLSATVKRWTAALLVSVASIIGYVLWERHTNTPSYKAGQRLEQAERLRKEGKFAEAAQIYREVAEGPTDKSPEAMKAIADLLDNTEMQEKGDPKEVAGVFRVAWDVRNRPGAVPDLFARGLRLAEARAAENPEGSLAVLEAVDLAAPEPGAVLPTKQKILERLVAHQPDDVELLSKLAVVYEQGKQRDRCLPLLEPHVKKLSTTEGARILGLIYYEKGKDEEALALLQPYADQRLKVLQEAAEQYEKALLGANEQLIAQLKNETAPGFDFARAKTATKQVQGEMVREYINKHLGQNSELNRLQEALARQMVVVPVALDLGSIRLTRAQRMTKPVERKAELELAEKTFLSVRGVASDQAGYRISLGQVYYWLGKQEEGRKLFEEILQAEGRKFETLLLVAGLFRELGAMAEARTLLEEGYNQKGVELRQRQSAAAMRAITSKDLDDEIEWLDRADPTDPQVKATLAESRGRKAIREDKEPEAATHYREAVALYAAQPENATTLNNGGLASLRLYYVSGEREALEQSVRMLEKAVALKPGDGILVCNVADAVLGAAFDGLVGDRIEMRKLKRQASLADLAFLYQDAAGRKALTRQARESALLTKARSHSDRALILAPNSVRQYLQCQALLHFLGDRDGLANLDRRAAEAKPDLAEARQEMRDFWQGKNEEKFRREMASSVARAERTVTETRAVGGATFAVAVGSLLGIRMSQETLGMPFDADEMVRLAEEADRLAPSVGTRSILQSALLARASKTLVAQETEYAAMADKGRRTLGSSYLIAVALWREGKPRAAALANADVKRVLELIRANSAEFPEAPSEWAWVMLRAAHPEDAARIATALKSNELVQLERALGARLLPPSPDRVLRQCWVLDASGKSEEAQEVLKRSAADGIPLPFAVP